jgi:chloride channel protein, CIC family
VTEENHPNSLPKDFPPNLLHSLALVAGAALVGSLTSLVGVAFLSLLSQGNALRQSLVVTMRDWPPGIGLAALMFGTAGCALLGAYLVKRFAPNAAGSGVPDVERILRGTETPNHAFVLPVKFLGGLVALSSGLVLGREGPLVQMGSVIGERVGRLFHFLPTAWKSLMAAGAGAGLCTAFNAPVGGTIFILEEVLRKVTPIGFVLAATAASTAALVQRGVFGMGQEYKITAIVAAGSPFILPAFVCFGLLVGFLGVAYNKFLLSLVASRGPVQRIPFFSRALLIGLAVGAVAWFLPLDVGGGDDVTQRVLAGQGGIILLLTIALARFFLGPLSYVSGTPGGLFAPIVTLGALIGASFGTLLHSLAPDIFPAPLAFAVAGMAAFFTASIRAPLTGIVICLEMTSCFELFLPMLATCLGAYFIPTLLRNDPIYDALANSR